MLLPAHPIKEKMQIFVLKEDIALRAQVNQINAQLGRLAIKQVIYMY